MLVWDFSIAYDSPQWPRGVPPSDPGIWSQAWPGERAERNFPLLVTRQNGHAVCVHARLAAGARPDQVNTLIGTFPLLMASQYGHAGCIHAILAARGIGSLVVIMLIGVTRLLILIATRLVSMVVDMPRSLLN